MKLNKLATILLAITLLCGILPLAIIPKVKAGDTTLSISPATVQKAYGDIGHDFTLDVKIADIADLYGFDINVTWENSLITSVPVDYINAFDALWGSGNYAVIQNSTGAGYYRIVVVAQSPAVGFTGSGTLLTLTFHIVRGSNVAPLQTPIHFETAKLSDSNATSIPATVVDGLYEMSSNTPVLKWVLVDPDPAKPDTFGKIFNLTCWANHISSPLTGFNITVKWDPELFRYAGFTWVGDVVGGKSYTPRYNGTAGTETSIRYNGPGWVGDNGFLFHVRIKIYFNDSLTHVWTTNGPHDLTGSNFSLLNAKLNFTDGIIPLSGIYSMGLPLANPVHLIPGDVNCDGIVNIADASIVLVNWQMTVPPGDPRADITGDGIVNIADVAIIGANWNS